MLGAGSFSHSRLHLSFCSFQHLCWIDADCLIALHELGMYFRIVLIVAKNGTSQKKRLSREQKWGSRLLWDKRKILLFRACQIPRNPLSEDEVAALLSFADSL